jgi:hypothetical protein
MKLKHCIATKDYSKFKKVARPSFYNYYDTLTQILYPLMMSLDSEIHEGIENSGRLDVYAVREWYCSDQHVGLYLYLIDGEAVCLMHQTGRKSYPEWTFLSEAALVKTRAFFDEYLVSDKPTYNDNPDDLMELEIDPILFDSQVTPLQMGLSPFHGYENFLEHVEKCSNIGFAVDILKELIADYEKFLEYHASSSTQEDYERYVQDGQVHYERALNLLHRADITV